MLDIKFLKNVLNSVFVYMAILVCFYKDSQTDSHVINLVGLLHKNEITAEEYQLIYIVKVVMEDKARK